MVKNKKRMKYKRILILPILIVVAVGVFLAWRAYRPTSPSAAVTKQPVTATTPKQPAPADETAKSDKQVAGPSTLTQGAATDTHGAAATNTDSSTWTVAASGNITVKSPAANATLSSGSVLSGSATLKQVEYRLIDDQVGVIAQGPLTVTNGNFSGTLSFTSKAKTGRLDVFGSAANGAETDEVQIPIKFSE
jgi:hypothetical protein